MPEPVVDITPQVIAAQVLDQPVLEERLEVFSPSVLDPLERFSPPVLIVTLQWRVDLVDSGAGGAHEICKQIELRFAMRS